MKIIIGIHGLKNKPPKKYLAKWWKEAIINGFKQNGYKIKQFKFRFVYWADLNYETPEEPVQPEIEGNNFLEDDEISEVEKKIRKQLRKTIEFGLDMLFLKGDKIIGLDKIADIAIRKNFTDLDIYYRGECITKPGIIAKKAYRERLLKMLKKYKNCEIMLLAHSMGSIIAYDTLMEFDSKVNVSQLVTIGSPLGLPVIIKRILTEQGKNFQRKELPAVPEAIEKSWDNLSDLKDSITLIYNLKKEFTPSSKGVEIVDTVVSNKYSFEGKSNHHKIYGYLQTPEFSEIAYQFLTEEPKMQKIIMGFFKKLFRNNKANTKEQKQQEE